jgi:hypothetical protein
MVTRFVLGAVALGAVLMVVASLPEIARYLRLREM